MSESEQCPVCGGCYPDMKHHLHAAARYNNYNELEHRQLEQQLYPKHESKRLRKIAKQEFILERPAKPVEPQLLECGHLQSFTDWNGETSCTTCGLVSNN